MQELLRGFQDAPALPQQLETYLYLYIFLYIYIYICTYTGWKLCYFKLRMLAGMLARAKQGLKSKHGDG